ncbi:MAG: NAD-dependent epimerase/dehydratase family protein [Candidatus Obscuribacterales bacterium]|nr:NAD-dependent epimerase/dehydratase family protein [Candidatus Obscuribacterales bacterium]
MILVTGATGMIGSALVARLVRQGKPVRLAVRNSTLARTALSKTTDLTGVDLQECDFLSSERDLTSLVSGCDIVVHLAGLVHQPDKPAEMFEELNLRTTGRLAHTAKSCGVDTFLFTSTMAVYGPPPFENISEEAKPNPDTDYGRTKLAAEKSLAEIRPARSVIVLRPSLVYGPGDRGNMLPLIRQILKRRYFHIGEASARKSVIYAADLAQVIESALEKAPAGFHVYNVSNPTAPSVREIADQILAAAELDGKIPTFPEILVRVGSYASLALGNKSPLPPSRLDKLTKPATCAVSKLQALTGFQPEYTLHDGLKAEIHWAKTSGQLNGIKP